MVPREKVVPTPLAPELLSLLSDALIVFELDSYARAPRSLVRTWTSTVSRATPGEFLAVSASSRRPNTTAEPVPAPRPSLQNGVPE